MANPDRRRKLESSLREALRLAESQAFQDPQVKKRMEQLRLLYLDNQQDFLFALGVSEKPSQPRPKLPFSRIPHLIFLLDSIGKKGALPLPSRKNGSGILPTSLLSGLKLPRSSSPPTASPPTRPTGQTRSPISLEVEKKRSLVLSLELKIQELTSQYQAIKKEEEAVRLRRGKYAIPTERLKAERYLRELPGQIAEAAHQKKNIEDELGLSR